MRKRVTGTVEFNQFCAAVHIRVVLRINCAIFRTLVAEGKFWFHETHGDQSRSHVTIFRPIYIPALIPWSWHNISFTMLLVSLSRDLLNFYSVYFYLDFF